MAKFERCSKVVFRSSRMLSRSVSGRTKTGPLRSIISDMKVSSILWRIEMSRCLVARVPRLYRDR